jgi:hypothetical protein
MSQEIRPTTAAIATAIQNQVHGNPELLLVAVAVVVGVGDAAGGAITMVVRVGCALAAGLLSAGVVGALVVGGADVAGADVSAAAVVAGAEVSAAGAAGADVSAGAEAAEPRPALTLEAMLLAADDTLLAALQPASSPMMMTIRPANPAPFFRTLNPSRTRLRCPHQAGCAEERPGAPPIAGDSAA